MIEVMDKGQRTTFDKRVAIAPLDLVDVLNLPKTPLYGAVMQIYDHWTPIFSVEVCIYLSIHLSLYVYCIASLYLT